MRILKLKNVAALVCSSYLLLPGASLADQRLGLGQALDLKTLSGWDIDISSSGQGLPLGSGISTQGEQIYSMK